MSSDSSYDPGQHLSFGDIAVDNQANPSYLQVYLKQSKAGPFRNRVKIIIGQASGSSASIHGSQGTRRGPSLLVPGWPFFNATATCCQAQRGTARSWPSPIEICRAQLPHWGSHNGGSLWNPRVPDKNNGRWENVVYQLYVRTPQEQLAAVAATLTGVC